MSMFLVKSRDDVLEQLKKGVEAMEASGAKNMREFAKLDHKGFCNIVDAYLFLGIAVSKELRDLAGVRPVEEVLA